MDLDLSSIESIEVKEDGSLMSTVLYGDTWFIKSKTSFKSMQCELAMDYLNSDGMDLNNQISEYLKTYPNRTINFELVSPKNQIVLLYTDTKLKILNVRDNITGKYYNIDEIGSPDLSVKLFNDYDLNGDFINGIYEMSDTLIEGFVIKLKSDIWFKVKTDKYSALHRAISQITNPKKRLDVILNDAADDIKCNFRESPELLKPLLDMEPIVMGYYNHMVATVERFNLDNIKLSQKDFAILAKSEHPHWMGLIMSLRNNKEIQYYKWMMKYYLDLYGD